MNSTEKVWKQLSVRLRSFIRSKINDQAAAEDVLQELFVKIHLKIDTLKDSTRLTPWLFQIARNQIADYYRNLKKIPHDHISAENEEDDPDETLMEEAVQDMVNMMDDLPADHCEALCRTELEGLSLKEYAERTGISYTAAKSRVQRSRKLLGDMLMKCCHYQFDQYGTVLSISPRKCCCCNSKRPA
jgi:RNA polymerase sigma-70 factor, ECF subfamily